ncbi:hypothetical protein D3C78_1061890 [compost metagenome]
MQLGILGRHQRVERLADDAAGIVAGQPAAGGVDGDHPLAGIHQHDALVAAVEHAGGQFQALRLGGEAARQRADGQQGGRAAADGQQEDAEQRPEQVVARPGIQSVALGEQADGPVRVLGQRGDEGQLALPGTGRVGAERGLPTPGILQQRTQRAVRGGLAQARCLALHVHHPAAGEVDEVTVGGGVQWHGGEALAELAEAEGGDVGAQALPLARQDGHADQ